MATLEEIKKHWEKAGESFPLDAAVTPTSRDPYLGLLERENFLCHLHSTWSVLEIGTGDAFHSVHYAEKIRSYTGLDLSENLLKIAHRRFEEARIAPAELRNGSVLDLKTIFDSSSFDCVISQRCLINLPNWETQQDALNQIHALLKPGGLLLLSEGFQENLENLNSIRIKLGLTPISTAEYNKNFSLPLFESYCAERFETIGTSHYGEYLFFSRVFYPLAVFPEEPRHDSPLNKTAWQVARVSPMEDSRSYSYNLFYVLKKK